MRKELKKSFYQPLIMSEENNTFNKNIDLDKGLASNHFKVIKGSRLMELENYSPSINQESTTHGVRASNIGLDLRL